MGMLGPIEFLTVCFAPGLFGLWLWMIIDCAMNEKEGAEKIVWMLVILFANFVGALIYLFARKLPRDRETPSAPA